MTDIENKILNFKNKSVDPSIINHEQIKNLVHYLINIIDNDIDGDVVEFGCYVGESSKYLMKTLNELQSNKQLYVYDSFEGLPDLSEWEKNTGWRAGTLKTNEDVLIQNFKSNGLPLPIIHKDWFKDVPNEKIPNKICYAFLDGDFYDSIYDSLVKIYDNVVDGGVILFHDYLRPDLPGVDAAIRDFLKKRGVEYDVVEICNQVGLMVKSSNSNLIQKKIIPVTKKMSDTTIVTGLWNIGRDKLDGNWSRSFDYYLNKFAELLKTDVNMIIFGDETLQEFVNQHRDMSNTQFVLRSLEWFKSNEYYSLIQQIRNNPEWYNQVGWLKDSTQAKLELYNPLVMSKLFLLNDAKILDKFNSNYMFWLDAGITNTVHPGYFTHDKVLEKLPKYYNKFSFICFPYDTETEIHGFEYNNLNRLSGHKVNKVARGGFFGGPKETINDINTIYYNLLTSTLTEGYMGTEESLFSIMCYKHSDLINYFEVDNNGLIGTFFENLKNDSLVVKSEQNYVSIDNLDLNNVALYVITFNSPKQFETLLHSMLLYDSDFINKPKKFLLDNSSDLSTTEKYIELCEEFNFVHIKKDNLGICGGRQFIAEHAEENGFDFHFFFEDDMFFYNGKESVCKNGFNRYVKNLYKKILNIVKNEGFDFVKMNYTEFYGDNGTQWSWYNVPQSVREHFWPEKPSLPVRGLDPNAPKTKYDKIVSYDGIPYASGEVYYCNWPQVVTRDGNKKMFLNTTWAHPFEQTWMSHIYQETKKGNIKPGLLLLTPTEHDRFDFYDAGLRKES
jgi:O-methyltransferase